MYDTGIWLRLAAEGNLVTKAAKIVRDRRHTVVTSAVSLAEITSVLVRRGLQARVDETLADVARWGAVLEVDSQTFVRAGHIHGQERAHHSHFSLADCILLEQARAANARILTTDRRLANNRQGVKATVP
jgi:predicted nucleic acid-binding protein